MNSAVGDGVLLVCTANICRSPTAELMLRHRLHRAGEAGLKVSSAGIRGNNGHLIDDQMAARLVADGIDPSAFRARRLTASQIAGAQLILTAAAEHRTTVVQIEPHALRRTFTMLEFVRLVDAAGRPGRGDPTHRLAQAQEAALAARPYHRLPARELSIIDPYGRSRSDYSVAYRRLSEFAHAMAAIVLPA